jgi:hypothetical protein
LSVVVLAILAGCETEREPDAGPPPCPADAGFLGSPDAEPEIEVGEITFEGDWVPISEGATLSLFTPPQGGKIALVGARVTNMQGCGAHLTGRLRDPTQEGEPVVAHEGRIVRFEPMGDGWGEVPVGEDERTVLAAGANLPACFNYEARDMDGCDWVLHVTVEDQDGRSVEARFPVGLTCLDADPGLDDPMERQICECECAAHYDERDCQDLEAWRDVPAVCE